jgi:hypothetical protein
LPATSLNDCVSHTETGNASGEKPRKVPWNCDFDKGKGL